ncbi:type 1 fimbrial protein [Acinetobacter suaedae]|uniref:Type 1 fimbrial protein n=1 Tax=Acinetobacter suaedae TaxID=2609668 RepID=A0A5P1UVI2_9GAMM|nr:type 1 fimbrial protein [Acinetobacter sp. C16S1]QER39840.1 type 1 fimbrial protein [Acinetobacter sp. C16S1]
MNSIIYKLILSTLTIIFVSASHATNTIQINGKIIEDTCSQQHQHRDCELISNLNKKIDNNSISLIDLQNKSQKNNMIEINIEKQTETNNSVIVVSYY